MGGQRGSGPRDGKSQAWLIKRGNQQYQRNFEFRDNRRERNETTEILILVLSLFAGICFIVAGYFVLKNIGKKRQAQQEQTYGFGDGERVAIPEQSNSNIRESGVDLDLEKQSTGTTPLSVAPVSNQMDRDQINKLNNADKVN